MPAIFLGLSLLAVVAYAVASHFSGPKDEAWAPADRVKLANDVAAGHVTLSPSVAASIVAKWASEGMPNLAARLAAAVKAHA